MKLKGCTAILMAAVLFVTALPAAFAGTFPDVLDRHGWAAAYIEDMVGRGLLKGYTDGTFKPDNPISKLEAVILAARILGVTYDENADFVKAANEAFSADLAGYDIQYKQEAAYLLYWGALNIADLPAYIGADVKNTAMRRYEVAVLLTKVMGGDREARSDAMVVLDFADDGQIPAAAKAYVQYISRNGIMNGMENNQFMPMTDVTRAMMATMMHRCEQAMDATAAEVTVTSVLPGGSFTASVSGQAAEVRFDLSDDTRVNVDGKAATVADLKAGYDARVHYQGEAIRMVEGLSTKTRAEKSGVIAALSNNSGARVISLKTAGSDATEPYPLAEDCVIYVDKAETMFSSLKMNYYVTVSVKDGKAVRISAETKETTYYGAITDVNLTETPPVITITQKDGSQTAFALTEN
ncbi:MAG: S-layer homology domain-containing protein, partial [Clostridiales bacterium]|nr:S-layer homology domain-containing protein [Clostridiales bacterium]